MPGFVDRTPSAPPAQFFAPGLLALFAADPPALETLRLAGRWLASQVGYAPGPATVDQVSRLRLKVAAAGLLMDCAAPDYLADLVAQEDFAASWRFPRAPASSRALPLLMRLASRKKVLWPTRWLAWLMACYWRFCPRCSNR